MVKAASSVPRVETKLFATEVSAVTHTQHTFPYVHLNTQTNAPTLQCTHMLSTCLLSPTDMNTWCV